VRAREVKSEVFSKEYPSWTTNTYRLLVSSSLKLSSGRSSDLLMETS